MNPFMIIFFMFYNFVMPKIGIIFALSYFLYAYCKDHEILELNTWYGFVIASILAVIFQLLISGKIFKITYKRFMNKVSNVEPFVAEIISIFVCCSISIILGIYVLEHIIYLDLLD